jgi:hypothetical protein
LDDRDNKGQLKASNQTKNRPIKSKAKKPIQSPGDSLGLANKPISKIIVMKTGKTQRGSA